MRFFFQLQTPQVCVSGYPQQNERNLFSIIRKKHPLKLFEGVNPIGFTCFLSLITNCPSKGKLLKFSILDWHLQRDHMIWDNCTWTTIKKLKLKLTEALKPRNQMGQTHGTVASEMHPRLRETFRGTASPGLRKQQTLMVSCRRRLLSQGPLRTEIRLYHFWVENSIRNWTC